MSGSPEPTQARSLRSALRLLRRPPVPAAVRFKPIIDVGSRCQVAAYTDARFVIDQLNAVCGGRWQARYVELPVSHRATPRDGDERPMLYVVCELTVFGETRSDVGEGRDGTTHGAGPKAAYSDALKRAAVHFGVNQAIYALRAPWLPVFGGEGQCPAGMVARSAKGNLYVPDATLTRLRDLYRGWLDGAGRTFGAPIDFGEDPGSLGLEAAGAEPVEHEEQPAPEVEREPSGATPDGSQEGEDQPVVEIGAARSEPATGREAIVVAAAPAGRKRLVALAERGGYPPPILSGVAELCCGETILDRLSERQLDLVAETLALAVAGRIEAPKLARTITKALAKPDRGAARDGFARWLSEQAGVDERAA